MDMLISDPFAALIAKCGSFVFLCTKPKRSYSCDPIAPGVVQHMAE